MIPSMDAWLKEAKKHKDAGKIGMYLTHNGVVRESPKAQVREGEENLQSVKGMVFGYNEKKLEEILADAYEQPGIYYVKIWLNRGRLKVGDDLMYVLIGGDIRPRVVSALIHVVGRLKAECVMEREIF